MPNKQDAEEKSADAQGRGTKKRARNRQAKRGESWVPDWDGWLARKAALRAASGICSDAPPFSDGLGRHGVTQQGSGSAGSGR